MHFFSKIENTENVSNDIKHKYAQCTDINIAYNLNFWQIFTAYDSYMKIENYN